MDLKIPVDEILARVPHRARIAYTHLVTHEATLFDQDTGWSCAYLTQQALADDMHVCLRTATRAVRDLRGIGLVRVLAWPGSKTETQVRVGDIHIGSPFGPIRMAQQLAPHHVLVDNAIALMVDRNRRLEDRMHGME
ncbi:hypothetical protein [Actinacidiphila glaucinigra]|uniref:hypothetical protein n=1 Tax=Actinacidiphila glaucinigra TaxID=235986 RepID=UPI00366E20D8